MKLASRARYTAGGSLTHRLTIGSATGATESLFQAIHQVVVLLDGSVCVADGPFSGNPSVRVFSRDGRLVRTIGRVGQGPGEFRSPFGVAQIPDGRILIQDIGNHRINVYSAAGEPLTQWPFARGNRVNVSPGSMFADTSGMVYVRIAGPESAPGVFGSRFVRVLPTGQVRDTVPITDQLIPAGEASATLRNEGGVSRFGITVPYTPATLWAISPLGYLVTAASNRYSLDLRIPGARRSTGNSAQGAQAAGTTWWQPGDAIVAIRRATNPIPVTSAERAETIRAIESDMRGIDPQWRWNGPEIPQVKPVLKSIFVAADGHIWASVSTPSERFIPPQRAGDQAGARARLPWREPTIYDVFEPDGTYLGPVSVPFGVTVAAVRGEDVWGIATDSEDVQTLQLFRLAWR